MITSDAHDGTDRGKSVIMKALYHTMGADCYFEGKWDDSNKTYILRFCVDDDEYYIFRHNKLFKVFDGEKNLLFSVISRHELSERLSSITGFAVKLPPRERNSDDGYVQELEIASAVYNYICERITENQLIVSGLGFSGDEILDSFDSVITLTNNKYELLCQEDYDANVSLLRELNNK